DDRFIRHELEKRCQINAFREGVDRCRLVRRGELNNANLWPKGRFPQKFGVDRDKGMLRKPRAEGGHVFGGGKETHCNNSKSFPSGPEAFSRDWAPKPAKAPFEDGDSVRPFAFRRRQEGEARCFRAEDEIAIVELHRIS